MAKATPGKTPNRDDRNTRKNHHRRRRVLVSLVAALLVLAGIALLVRWFGSVEVSSGDHSGTVSTNGGQPTGAGSDVPAPTKKPAQMSTSKPTAKPVTTQRKPAGSSGYVQPAGAPWNLVLVNKWNPLASDYSQGLTLVNYDSPQRQFDSRAIDSLRAMIQAGSAYRISAASTYRSVELQTTLYNRKVNEYLSAGYSQQRAEEVAATIVAKPGTSEHNTALVVDVLGSGYTSLVQSFENTEAFRWLKAHCAEYGFILRYPKEWEAVTGVIYEPWHYRYVGVEHAKAIMERGITLEQYLEEKGW